MDLKEELAISDDAIDQMRAMGYLYVRQGAYAIALKVFDALIALNPGVAYDLQTVGAIYLQQGDPLRSLEYLDRALQIEPEHPFTQLNRAKALLLLGYKKQSFQQAATLLRAKNPEVVAQAAALIEGNR